MDKTETEMIFRVVFDFDIDFDFDFDFDFNIPTALKGWVGLAALAAGCPPY